MADRGGNVDSRYCIDNGAMIAQAGVLAFEQGIQSPVQECDVTQRCVCHGMLVLMLMLCVWEVCFFLSGLRLCVGLTWWEPIPQIPDR